MMVKFIGILILVSGLFSCATNKPKEKTLIGSWDNKKGQILEFKANNNALWIFYTESKRDTFEIKYSINFSEKPYHLDLTDFKVGPLKGKTLYGIVEFKSNAEIRFDCEPSKEKRPKEFDKDQTQTYFKSENRKN